MKRKFAVRAFAGWLHNWYRSAIRHPKWRWWLIAGSLVYLLDPFDLSPDMLPIVGWVDDGLIATALVTEVAALMSDRLKRNKASGSSTSASASASEPTVEVSAQPVA
jgi:uncharacterized membrane protein YkvA (DUF1232 family)